MALAELIGKLRSKRQATERTAFSHYLEAVKELANGGEIDADEVGYILDAADKSESDLERDVGIQQQRLAWAAQLAANRQATADRIQAERDFLEAQRALQEAYDRLQPAIEAARARMQVAEQAALSTINAEARLSEKVLDQELLHREAAVIAQLKETNSELSPLLQDREHKRSSLMNAELRLQQLTSRDPDAWPGFGMINPKFWSNKDIDPARERVADLRSQLAQLDRAIQPRQQEQQRLQAELDATHRQKLEP